MKKCQQEECSPSPFTQLMSHGDAIPAMQMQTCMIFVQIPLSGPIIISQLSPFLFPKTTMARRRAKDGEENVPETYQQRGMESPSFETSVTHPSGTERSLQTPTVNDYYPPPSTQAPCLFTSSCSTLDFLLLSFSASPRCPLISNRWPFKCSHLNHLQRRCVCV